MESWTSNLEDLIVITNITLLNVGGAAQATQLSRPTECIPWTLVRPPSQAAQLSTFSVIGDAAAQSAQSAQSPQGTQLSDDSAQRCLQKWVRDAKWHISLQNTKLYNVQKEQPNWSDIARIKTLSQLPL